VNTKKDRPERRERLHILILGPPALAKTALILKSTRLVPNSSFDNAQTSTGISLLAVVEKDEDTHILRLGPIPRSKGAISCIDELNRMSFSDQEKLFGVMEEGFFTSNKYGIRALISSPTTILATANPRVDSSPNENTKLDLGDLKIIPAVLDRFDLKFNVKPPKDEKEIRELAYGMCEQEDVTVPDYSQFLRKYIAFAKCLNPILSDEAKIVLTEYFVSMRLRNPTISPRRQKTLFNLARARARLQLKEVADLDDAKAVIEYYGKMVADYENTTLPPEDPMDITYRECLTILEETKLGDVPMAFSMIELVETACQRNSRIEKYLRLGRKGLQLRQNKKVRHLYELLVLNKRIKKISKSPIVLQCEP
jgi:replicative DNA helicase Mcm